MRRGWVAAPAAALALVGVAGPASGAPAPAASEQRYVVTFDAGTPAGAQSDQVSSATGDDGQRIGPDAVVVDATTAEAQQLAAGSDVRVVEADVPAVAAALPSDPCFLGPGCPNATSQVGLRRIHAQLAWDVVTGAAAPGGVVVGLIDTGVASWAPELDASRVQLVPESSCASVVGTVDDTPNGHGTMVAGIVGAAGNTTGIAGVVPGNVSIRSYKVLTADSRGSTADVAGAIDCAIHDGVDVINMSLTVGADETFVRNAVSRAAAAGIVIVAAAGNAGNAASPGAYPAAYPDVVAVAAVDANDRRAVFSNGGSWVDLAAPGTNVLSTRSILQQSKRERSQILG